MRKLLRCTLWSTLVVLLILLAWQGLRVDASRAEPPLAHRYLVQLAESPVATYGGGLPGLPATARAKTGERRLDIEAKASQAYVGHLKAQQGLLEATLKRETPNAQVERSYQVVFNGLAVQLAQADVAKVRALPGVQAVIPERAYSLTLDQSVPLIGAPSLWQQLGGADQGGRGVKVAVLDSGIYISNTFFNPTGFTYPPGFPKGEAAYTTPKVIAARAYFRPDDPPAPGHETPLPGSNSHGTHVAGIIAGRADTQVTLQGELAAQRGLTHTLAGVAPGAWLMNYKIFYQPRAGSSSAYTPEILAALEDAVVDGADILSNSWGADAIGAGWADPIVQAVEAAVEAGVVVVFAAGNSGPNQGTIGTPALSSRVITVGASTVGLSLT